MNTNRELAKLLGLCWHQMERIHPGGIFKRCYKCLKPESEGIKQPDFTSDSGKIELLRLMKDKGQWFPIWNLEDLLMDTTGRLAQAALEWLTAKEAQDDR